MQVFCAYILPVLERLYVPWVHCPVPGHGDFLDNAGFFYAVCLLFVIWYGVDDFAQLSPTVWYGMEHYLDAFGGVCSLFTCL